MANEYQDAAVNEIMLELLATQQKLRQTERALQEAVMRAPRQDELDDEIAKCTQRIQLKLDKLVRLSLSTFCLCSHST